MTSYIIRRLLLMIPTFLAVTVIVFFLDEKAPGNQEDRQKMEMIAQGMDENSAASRNDSDEAGQIKELSEEDRKLFMKSRGRTGVFYVDYFNWLKKVCQGDFGNSDRYEEPALKLVLERMPISLFYGLASMFLVYIICIPLGIWKALKNNSWFDKLSSIGIFLGYAIPSYALGALLFVWVCSKWGWFPLGGFVSDNYDELSLMGKFGDLFYHSIMPMCCYMIGSFAVMTMLVKNTMLDTLSSDYIRTALAKGVPYKKAVFKHALDNSLVPLATHFGSNISVIISGSFLIEKIFNIDGMGLLGFQALENRDSNLVMCTLAISCLLMLIGNLLSDICVAMVDPRVSYD